MCTDNDRLDSSAVQPFYVVPGGRSAFTDQIESNSALMRIKTFSVILFKQPGCRRFFTWKAFLCNIWGKMSDHMIEKDPKLYCCQVLLSTAHIDQPKSRSVFFLFIKHTLWFSTVRVCHHKLCSHTFFLFHTTVLSLIPICGYLVIGFCQI